MTGIGARSYFFTTSQDRGSAKWTCLLCAAGVGALLGSVFWGCGSATPLVKDKPSPTGAADVVDVVESGVMDTGGGDADVIADNTIPEVSDVGGEAVGSDGGEDTSGSVQPTCSGAETTLPKWYHESVGYEIFVRSFQDSDGDGIGDFQGLRSRLDYLNDGNDETDTDLGVDLLWLMPVFESPSYHGYDVTDYRTIEPDYGTAADFQGFLDDAHARGIRVVVDLVLNHSSNQHPWFVDAAANPQSTFRDYYVWSDQFLDWQKPWGPGTTWHKKGSAWYYGLFSSSMPDLNLTTEPLQAELVAAANHWLAVGVDGFRLDAARYLIETGPGEGQADTPETHLFWRQFRENLAQAAPDMLLLGEVWEKTDIVIPYFGSSNTPELNMLFDFESASALLQTISTGKGLYYKGALCERIKNTPSWAAAGSFLTNHDMTRVASELAAQGQEGLKLAAALMLLGPGTPWIYYGEEIGMTNGKGSGDEAKRLPMQWSQETNAGFSTAKPWQNPSSVAFEDSVAGQTDSATSVLSTYRTLIRLRKSSVALRLGKTEILDGSGSGNQPLVMIRKAGNETIVVVANPTGQEVSWSWKTPESWNITTQTDKITGERVVVSQRQLNVESLEPLGFRVLEIE